MRDLIAAFTLIALAVALTELHKWANRERRAEHDPPKRDSRRNPETLERPRKTTAANLKRAGYNIVEADDIETEPFAKQDDEEVPF